MARLSGDSISRMLQSHFCRVRRLRRRVHRLPGSRGICVALSARSLYVGGYGWSRHANLADACDAFQLLINLEQQPNPENRLLLARTRDVFGSPRVDLFWRWSAREQENLQRLRMVIASALEDSGLGRVEINADSGLIRTHTIIQAPRECTPILVGVSLMLTAGFMEPIICS